ncbi:CHAP domain-containing protein [Kribbella pratensis]|uniref:CHAP domain-containing protein n=1 Tax=Kribbella pratensis TaxID=2512112 RepID=A0A4R8BKY3_9ACTN|nr:CHAP domain-containing protein [Kribbella pratensis]TDW54701.1 CHAP domain-containing protein [Kribbella pratensis]
MRPTLRLPLTAVVLSLVSSVPLTATAAETRTQIVNAANGEVGQGETPPGSNCNPYGACESWCAHFATWTWRKAGSDIPNYGFTGDIYTWGQRKGRAHSGNTGMKPGDIVLYGTGPQNTSTSLHTGVVVATGNGKITTVEGNSHDKVQKLGPFDPKHAKNAGRPGNIYGWVSAQ